MKKYLGSRKMVVALVMVASAVLVPWLTDKGLDADQAQNVVNTVFWAGIAVIGGVAWEDAAAHLAGKAPKR